MRTSARATGTAAVVCGSAMRQEAGVGGSCKAGPFISRLSCFQLQEWYGSAHLYRRTAPGQRARRYGAVAQA
ncbi:hypothetical protein GCM10010365_67540 [Streptomyces poonensis]|uniref:Uncharacterized protein n=1 Tax=Streptomyces poonensis TaxID=68255 RepID=A0A918UW56_9ACTN|nr:hypothetical protein GCM10010365_67540 [Streptomyces poonensis]GLJ90155.1 hypothetical protein GCM10017589_27560 [Streptomyces poonensis]